jgi:hypothetical protein
VLHDAVLNATLRTGRENRLGVSWFRKADELPYGLVCRRLSVAAREAGGPSLTITRARL